MKLILNSLFIVLFLGASCSEKPVHKQPLDAAYADSLNKVKKDYPFENWKKNQHAGLPQYTDANCNAARQIFDNLLAELAALGKDASEADKIALFKAAIIRLNELNDGTALIETGEAEQLVLLTNKIAIMAGIDPSKYGGGEGPASEWREW